MTDTATGLALLREPFPPNQISKLPKPTAKREVMDQLPKHNCPECGQWHASSKVMHLDYVGHAALTDRLLNADPMWTWEPLAISPDGLPVIDSYGGMWIKLTVCGVTRLGYGHAGNKEGGDAIKEIIGDALRNAAMRFGAALELWHKGELHADVDDDAPKAKDKQKTPTPAVGDTSPKAKAQRLMVGVSGGDVAGVAEALSAMPDAEYNTVWKFLDAKTQKAVEAEWKKAEVAA